MIKKHAICLALSLVVTPAVAQTRQESYGPCSPNIFTNNAPVNISCTIVTYAERGATKALKLVAINLPRNNEDERDTNKIIAFFDQLQGLDGEIVYFRLNTYVGAGFGFDNVPKNRAVRAGAIFDISNYLDGFGGKRSNYEYGYSVELSGYRNQWGRNRQSTILFPEAGNTFFDVHYMKAFSLDGLAKIRISDMQGFQWIEIVPAQPFGDLLAKYEEIREKLPKNLRREF